MAADIVGLVPICLISVSRGELDLRKLIPSFGGMVQIWDAKLL